MAIEGEGGKNLAVLVLESIIFMLKCGHIFDKLKP